MFLVNAWSRIFWTHARVLTNRLAPLQSRMRFWRSLLSGISDHRFVSVRPCKSSLLALETASNKLLRFIVGARPGANDTAESFSIQRNHVISAAKVECRFDVRNRLCWKLVTWIEHIWRHKDSRLFTLLQVHDELLLQTVRALAGNTSGNRSIRAGATRTRASAGMPLRWAAGWLEDVGRACGGWGNPNKDKRQSQQKAQFLLELVMTGSRTQHEE